MIQCEAQCNGCQHHGPVVSSVQAPALCVRHHHVSLVPADTAALCRTDGHTKYKRDVVFSVQQKSLEYFNKL